ncbi:hypothetical protein PILCRDRAFT_8453 [Piloderma croceum F 1598]|uniref:Uncharacterized protein n=1 Tax=Piloderma croceum (strain F 1598) TaxID=765440 RepID=A0A0C3FRM4_PILCF|nr:hypothetical protein PILCRDRAFT_8453 [Piloderma croceum F 1598]
MSALESTVLVLEYDVSVLTLWTGADIMYAGEHVEPTTVLIMPTPGSSGPHTRQYLNEYGAAPLSPL